MGPGMPNLVLWALFPWLTDILPLVCCFLYILPPPFPPLLPLPQTSPSSQDVDSLLTFTRTLRAARMLLTWRFNMPSCGSLSPFSGGLHPATHLTSCLCLRGVCRACVHCTRGFYYTLPFPFSTHTCTTTMAFCILHAICFCLAFVAAWQQHGAPHKQQVGMDFGTGTISRPSSPWTGQDDDILPDNIGHFIWAEHFKNIAGTG